VCVICVVAVCEQYAAQVLSLSLSHTHTHSLSLSLSPHQTTNSRLSGDTSFAAVMARASLTGDGKDKASCDALKKALASGETLAEVAEAARGVAVACGEKAKVRVSVYRCVCVCMHMYTNMYVYVCV
jgi:hypothetical protein